MSAVFLLCFYSRRFLLAHGGVANCSVKHYITAAGALWRHFGSSCTFGLFLPWLGWKYECGRVCCRINAEIPTGHIRKSPQQLETRIPVENFASRLPIEEAKRFISVLSCDHPAAPRASSTSLNTNVKVSRSNKLNVNHNIVSMSHY